MTTDRGRAGGDDPRGDWEALARYLAGESSPAEAATMRRLLAESPDDEALVRAMERAMARLPLASSAAGDVDVDAALRSVNARRGPSAVSVAPPLTVARGGAPRITTRATSPARRFSFAVPAIAAAAVLAIAFGTWRAKRPGSPAVVATAAPQVLRTAVGQRDSIRLSDGSQVVLAPMSEVAFSMEGGERVARLTGEGYFDVVHDESQPFVVHAGDATIRDIGTTFTVSRGDDREVTVVVTSGIVELGSAEQGTPQQGTPAAKSTVRLEKGDIGVRRPDGTMTLRRNAATDDATAWTRGQLVFRDAPFKEVAERVRRWHGVELRAADTVIASRHVTADLTGEGIDRVLQLLSLSLGAELERQGTLAVLRDAGGGGRRP